MGLHLSSLADLIGSRTVQSTERSGSTLADLRSNPSNGEGFSCYLERARSAGKSAPADNGKKPAPAEECQDAASQSDTNTETEADTDTSTGSSESAAVTHAVSTGSVDVGGQTSIESSTASANTSAEPADATSGESTAETMVKQSTRGGDPAGSSTTVDSSSKADAGAKDGQAALISAEESAAKAEGNVGSQAASKSGQTTTRVGEGEAEVAKSTTSGDSQSSSSKTAAQAKQDGYATASANAKADAQSSTPRDSVQTSTAGNTQTETKTSGETGKQTPQDDGRSQSQQGQRESFFDMKIKESIEAQRTGTSTQRNAQPLSGEGNTTQQDTTGSTSGKTQPALTSVDDLRDIKTVSIRQSSGDAGATSIAKLLLSGSGLSQLSSADAAGLASLQTVSGAESGGTSTSPGTSAVGTVSTASPTSGMSATGMLASGTEAADSLVETAEVLRAAASGGRQQATLKLDPPELGQVRVQVEMRNQDMRVQITAETQVAGKMLESRISELRDSLAVQGIRLERAEVVVRSPETGEPGQQHQGDNRQANGGRQQWQAGGSSDGFAQGERAFADQGDASTESGAFGASQEEVLGGIEPGVGEEAGILNTMSMAELSVDLVA